MMGQVQRFQREIQGEFTTKTGDSTLSDMGQDSSHEVRLNPNKTEDITKPSLLIFFNVTPSPLLVKRDVDAGVILCCAQLPFMFKNCPVNALLTQLIAQGTSHIRTLVKHFLSHNIL